MTRLVDLDDAAAVELAWMQLERRRAVRNIDPELRSLIRKRCERIAGDIAAPILAELDELHPGLVLEVHYQVLVPNRATIGAIRRQQDRP
jgi:hypothetical protein